MSEVRCVGCGSALTSERLAEMRALSPNIKSCCPEREPLDITGWMARAIKFEKQARDAAALVEQLQAKVDGTKAGRDFHIGTASELLALLADIIDAENDFRESMGVNWEGDPLSDAIEAARRFIKLETPALSSTERRGSE